MRKLNLMILFFGFLFSWGVSASSSKLDFMRRKFNIKAPNALRQAEENSCSSVVKGKGHKHPSTKSIKYHRWSTQDPQLSGTEHGNGCDRDVCYEEGVCDHEFLVQFEDASLSDGECSDGNCSDSDSDETEEIEVIFDPESDDEEELTPVDERRLIRNVISQLERDVSDYAQLLQDAASKGNLTSRVLSLESEIADLLKNSKMKEEGLKQVEQKFESNLGSDEKIHEFLEIYEEYPDFQSNYLVLLFRKALLKRKQAVQVKQNTSLKKDLDEKEETIEEAYSKILDYIDRSLEAQELILPRDWSYFLNLANRAHGAFKSHLQDLKAIVEKDAETVVTEPSILEQDVTLAEKRTNKLASLVFELQEGLDASKIFLESQRKEKRFEKRARRHPGWKGKKKLSYQKGLKGFKGKARQINDRLKAQRGKTDKTYFKYSKTYRGSRSKDERITVAW